MVSFFCIRADEALVLDAFVTRPSSSRRSCAFEAHRRRRKITRRKIHRVFAAADHKEKSDNVTRCLRLSCRFSGPVRTNCVEVFTYRELRSPLKKLSEPSAKHPRQFLRKHPTSKRIPIPVRITTTFPSSSVPASYSFRERPSSGASLREGPFLLGDCVQKSVNQPV